MASKRALSTLASKLHPQLPLSPRESQQLLTLLTTSFRAHLDREFPQAKHAPKPTGEAVQRSPSPHRATSSHIAASRHIDSILTNPLFAVKPHRRASEPAAVDVLRDPLTWFTNQIASGAATLPKALMCLDLLSVTSDPVSPTTTAKSLGTVLADWLRTSGTDTSREFVTFLASKRGQKANSLVNLLAILLAEEQAAVPWRWFIRRSDQRIKETTLDTQLVLQARQNILEKMVRLKSRSDINAGLSMFMQAFRMAEIEGHDAAYSVLRPAGASLVNHIMSTPQLSISPISYQSFMSSSQRWLGNWSQAVEAMLWLHHPSERNASQGLRYIQDPSGAQLHVNASRSRRNFLVQLCLGVARQLLEEEKYTDAQIAMEFTKTHFADLVLSKPPNREQQARHKVRKEQANLELLDRLIPT